MLVDDEADKMTINNAAAAVTGPNSETYNNQIADLMAVVRDNVAESPWKLPAKTASKMK